MLEDLLTGIADAGDSSTSRSSIDAVLHTYTSLGHGAARKTPLSEAVCATLASTWPDINFGVWSQADLSRIRLLLARADTLGDSSCAEAARACYSAGDASEQESWLRAVAMLPSPGQFLPQVVDACRTNILPVFRAVAIGNPYPSQHFPELNFNQMVLKALFNGVPLSGIVGLATRRNSELARMAGDYAAERRAAGRTVPEDIGLAL